jgi:hypothetical protein
MSYRAAKLRYDAEVQRREAAARAQRAATPPPERPIAKQTPEQRAALLKAAGEIATATGGDRAWAERMRDREAAGEHLTFDERRMWREALGPQPEDQP